MDVRNQAEIRVGLHVNIRMTCRCPPDNNYVYGGEYCEQKAEKLTLSSTTIIAIACGTGGGLVVILVIALFVSCLRRRPGAGGKHKGKDDEQKSE